MFGDKLLWLSQSDWVGVLGGPRGLSHRFEWFLLSISSYQCLSVFICGSKDFSFLRASVSLWQNHRLACRAASTTGY